MPENYERGGFYATIPAPVLDDPRLRYASMVLYAKIVNYARKDGFCYAKNEELMRSMEREDPKTGAVSGITERTLQGWLSELKAAGHILIDTGPLPPRDDGKSVIGRRIFIGGFLPSKETTQGGEKICGGENNFAEGVKKISPPIIGINNITKQEPPIVPQGGRRGKRSYRTAPDWKPERFEKFWKYYPEFRRKDKQKAMDEWDKLRLSDEQIDEVGKAMVRLMKSEEWQRGIGIPYPHRFLRDHRWDDAQELTETSAEKDEAPRAKRYVRTDIVDGIEVDIYE